MNHEQEALEAASVGEYTIATFHAHMFAAQQQRLSNLIALGETHVMVPDVSDGPWGTSKIRDDIRDGLGLNS